MPYCGKCGTKVRDDDKFCAVCGNPIVAEVSTSRVSSTQQPISQSSIPQYQPRAHVRGRHFGRNVAIVCILILIISVGLYYYVSMRQLKANLVDVGLMDAGLTSARVEVMIDVRNPSLMPISVTSGSFTIYINGQRLGYGSIGSFTVGANGLHRITVPVSFSYVDIGMTIANLITSGGAVRVTLDGSISTLVLSVPFATTLYDARFN